MLEMDELKREELLWKQKSRVTWLSSSDLNTKYFHALTVIRRCRNKIVELKCREVDCISGRSTIDGELVAFYSSLYSTNNPIIPQNLDNLVEKVITDEDNVLLIKVPEAQEIWDTLKCMHPDKASGPDGMTIFFFSHF